MSYLKKYDINKKGQDYVVGDIHGMFCSLYNTLKKLDFDFQNDRLFSVGDLCDRGPDSSKILQLLAQPWFHPVMGNHEQILFLYETKQVNESDMRNVGASWWLTMEEKEKKEILKKYQALPIAIQVQTATKKIGIIHAECPFADWNLLEQGLLSFNSSKFINTALWSTRSPENTHTIKNIDAVIVGHMTQDEYIIRGNTHLIDTGAVYPDGHFTILHLDSLTPNLNINKLKI